MGRYYWGDIEGKFAFAIQGSNAADRFGVYGQQPSHLEYYFEEEHIEEVQEELTKLEARFKELGILEPVLADKTPDKVPEGEGVDDVFKDIYDYWLGRKILKCLQENGSCQFQAELQ